MAEAEDLVASRGPVAVEVGVEHDNSRARSLYERLGYRPVGDEREHVHYEFEGQPKEMTVEQTILRKSLAGGQAVHD